MRYISRRLIVCQEPCHGLGGMWTRDSVKAQEVGFMGSILVSGRFPLAGGRGPSRIYPSSSNTDHYCWA